MRRSLLLLSLVAACKGSDDGAGAPAVDSGTTQESGVESCYEDPQPDGAAIVPATAPLTQYVSPFIGTGGVGFGVGSTFPGPQRPYGMARPGPDTSGPTKPSTFEHCSGYAYGDPFIYGFSQTRMNGTGIVDYGTIGVMPVIGMDVSKTTTTGRRNKYDKKSEKASPGYYAVTLDGGIQVELTATEHVAYHRYTFPSGSDANVLVDIGHALPDVTIKDGSIDADPAKNELSGFAQFTGGYSGNFGGMPVYFVARFSRPWKKLQTWKAGAFADATSQMGADTGAYAAFDATSDPKVGLAIGISFTDVAHARANLDAESKTFDFDATRTATEAVWEKELGRVVVEGRARDLKLFYSALYRSLLMPTLASDVDGSYMGLDKAVHTLAAGEKHYTDFSLWDTYRTLHPWLTLAYPEHQTDFLRSMVRMQQEMNADPKWVLGIGETGGMVGDSSAVVFADSTVKGLRDFDTTAAWKALIDNATKEKPNGRAHIVDYMTKGWVPTEDGGRGGATTLEFAFDDAALANMGDALGDKTNADMLRKRSGNWKNLWDERTHFLLGRKADGSFPQDDDATAWQEYWAEGDTWQYTWFVPHDVPGLADKMGGRDAFLQRLDDFFATSTCQPKSRLAPKPYYWHSNEVVLFVPWAFAELDDPVRSAKWVRWALANEYGDGPDGLPGNDDGGTMSAWYLFASLGIFPRVGTNEYLLGAPLFRKATLKLPKGDLVITADGAPGAATPTAFTWAGAKLSRPRVAHEQIVLGGTLSIALAP